MRWTRTLPVLVVLGVLALSACDGAARSREAHVGRHLALEVHHTATGVAGRIADRPDGRCGGLSLARRLTRWPVFTTLIETELTELTPTGEVAERPWLRQLVRLRRDAAGGLAMVEIADYDAGGQRGRRTREVRRVAERWQVREDGQPFVTLAGHEAGQVTLAEAVEGYERLLSAGGALVGDARSPHGLRLATHDDTDAERVRCGLRGGARPLWLDGLGDDWQVTSLAAHVELDAHDLPVRRRLTLELELVSEVSGRWGRRRGDDEVTRARLVLDETIKVGAAEPVHLAEHQMVPAVDRGFYTARALVRDRWADGLGLDVLGFYSR